MAVHPSYVSRPLWVTARQDGLCGTEIHIPILTNKEQLEAILARRLNAFGVDAELDDIFAEASFSRLFDIYLRRPEPTIRKCLTLVNAGVAVACEQRAHQMTGLHLESAHAGLG